MLTCWFTFENRLSARLRSFRCLFFYVSLRIDSILAPVLESDIPVALTEALAEEKSA